MHQEAFKTIQDAKHILLHLHPKPDPDSIGSALATYHALKGLGKEVTVIEGDSKLPEIFSFLPGYKNIVHQNYFETNLDDFDLFIIQDSGSKQIISRKGEVVFPTHLKTIIIDHHKTNDNFADINLVDPTYAATAEFLFDLFTEWGMRITPDIAANLYIAIYSDTGGFKYSSATPRTMKIISSLAEIYPKFTELVAALENNISKGQLFFEAIALNNIESYCDDLVALSVVTLDEMERKGITVEESNNAYNVVSKFLLVKEWNIAVILIERSSSEVKVSLRSKDDKYDVAKIAQALGGGGHTRAAGLTLMMPLEDAKKKVIDALKAGW